MSYNYKSLGIIDDNLTDFGKPVRLVRDRESGVAVAEWDYNQMDVIRACTLAMNSQFKDGPKDSRGRRKIYINDVQFVADVTKKNIDIDLKDWLFIPENRDFLYQAMLFKHDFFQWAKKQYYNELQDRLMDDFVELGTCVQKTVRGEVSRIPLSKISITQTADSILDAVLSGGYFIEHHEYSVHQLKDFPGWQTDQYRNHDGKVYLVERYGYIPKSDLQAFKGEKAKGDTSEMVLAMVIAGTTDERGNPEHVHFIEEITENKLKERYQEGWFQKVDGRWLGRGPVEQILENQVAKNITANLRLRNLEWVARRVFQSASSGMKNNLATAVQDGDVLEVSPNGTVSRVDMSSQGNVDFQQMDVMVDGNREQKTFSFEAASGDTMPSGTAFRLGLIQQNSVNKHSQKKQEAFAAFLKRGYFEQLVPKFKKENSDHSLTIMFGESGIEELKLAYITIRANRKVMEAARGLKRMSYAEAEAEVLRELRNEPYMMFDVKKEAYKDVRMYVDLVITGESQDIPEEIASLTSLYQTLAQAGDPAARAVLEEIFAKKGRDLNRITGGASAVQQPPAQQQPAQALPANPLAA